MSDSNLFLFGAFVFTVLTGGVAATVVEIKRMGDKDQDDAYPHTPPKVRRAVAARRPTVLQGDF